MVDCFQYIINQVIGYKLDYCICNGVVLVIVNIDVYCFGQMGDQYGDIEKKNNWDNYGVNGCCIINVGGRVCVNVKDMQGQVEMFNYYFDRGIEVVDCYDDYQFYIDKINFNCYFCFNCLQLGDVEDKVNYDYDDRDENGIVERQDVIKYNVLFY